MNTFEELKRIIQKNCLLEGKFKKSFARDFENLEEEITEPWLKQSWLRYDQFLQKYGSHVITGIVYGSSIEQYIFANSSKSYSKKDFEVKACLSLTGPVGAAALGVKSCLNVSKEEISKASSIATSESVVVTGGLASTRNRIRSKDRTKELITKFLDEGFEEGSAGPIQIKTTPIWDILQDSSTDNANNLVKAMNLEYYFNGFLNFGCHHKEVRGIELQRFEISPDARPGRPGYVCKLAGQGCRSNEDCRLKKLRMKCTCRGETCVLHKTKTLHNSGIKKEAVINKSEWKNGLGCGWSLSGAECECDRKEEAYPPEISWKSSDYRDFLEDADEESGEEDDGSSTGDSEITADV